LVISDTARTFIAGLRDGLSSAAEARQTARVETDEQLRRLERCLEPVGDTPSMFKNLATRTAAAFQGALRGMVSDEVIKDTLTGFTFEHFEIDA
jgi:ferritin-like metal-binding protein YciE